MKRALIAAIDNYAPPYTSLSNLNDLYELKNALESKGFVVSTLMDGGATKLAILNELQNLINVSVSGDNLCFAFFGHGSHLSNPVESDGTSECLCCYDWQSGGLIWDYELENMVQGLVSGCECDFIFGSCYAGGMVEGTSCTVWGACRELENSHALKANGIWRGAFALFFCWFLVNYPQFSRYQTYYNTYYNVLNYVPNQHCTLRGTYYAIYDDKPFW